VDLLTRLPDVPRWVEARGMLASGRGHVIGSTGDSGAVVAAADAALAIVVDWMDPARLSRAVAEVPREFTIVAPAEAWSTLEALVHSRPAEGATLFTLPTSANATLPAPDPRARLLRPEEGGLLDALPPELRGELGQAFLLTAIAATFVGGHPVAFCYAGWETKTLWDVSIDTLPAWRRQGLAQAAVRALVPHHAARGKSPVWGAADSNVASAALARKLGFEPVDRLLLIYPDDAHVHNAPYSQARIAGGI
jgi:GNAT superfamily N-acetyltransferase